MLGTTKFQLLGERAVVLVEFRILYEFTKKTLAKGTTPTLTQCIDLISDASTDVLLAALRGGVKLQFAHAQLCQTLKCPWGWICIEKVLG